MTDSTRDRTPRVGARVRILAGDLIRELGVITGEPEGRWQLYPITLDDENAKIFAARDRFEVID